MVKIDGEARLAELSREISSLELYKLRTENKRLESELQERDRELRQLRKANKRHARRAREHALPTENEMWAAALALTMEKARDPRSEARTFNNRKLADALVEMGHFSDAVSEQGVALKQRRGRSLLRKCRLIKRLVGTRETPSAGS